MCGLFGAIQFRGVFPAGDFRQFVDLTNLASHRGPDASGYRSFLARERSAASGPGERFDIFLGHRRLSIIDLSDAGTQPLTDGEGRWIVFNGEIFNYVELRRDLEAKGHRFHTQTDTEVILKSYAEFGPEGFKLFNGMWAFAIVDLPKRLVVLSRDRFSMKPLYYVRRSQSLYFASEIKQLLPLLPKRELNQRAMLTFLQQALVNNSETTFFQGIVSVKPKHSLLVDLDSEKVTERQYWEYGQDKPLHEGGAVEAFRTLFRDSIRLRLRSDVPIAALLSGGLDSSTIVVVADEFQPGGIATYSVVAKDRRYSEEKFINTLSRKMEIRNYKVLFDDRKALENLDSAIYYQDEPFGSLSVVAQYTMLQQIKVETSAKVLLSGQGGDETLGGYRKFFYFMILGMLRKGQVVQAASELLLSAINRTVLWQFSLGEAKRYMPWFSKKRLPFLLGPIQLEPLGTRRSLRTRQIDDIDQYSVPALARYEDRNSMAHALEVRLPFLDHRLVDFLLSAPDSMKIHHGWTKYVMRQAIPEVPKEIRWRRDKQGFVTEEESWLRHEYRQLLTETFQHSILADMGIIDRKLFMQYYDAFLKGNPSIWHTDITRVFVAELWAQKYLR